MCLTILNLFPKYSAYLNFRRVSKMPPKNAKQSKYFALIQYCHENCNKRKHKTKVSTDTMQQKTI